MKSTDDRFAYRSHFLTLAQGRIIPILQTSFWCKFWEPVESANEVFEVLTAADIKSVTDHNQFNFVILVRVLCLKVISLTDSDTKLSHEDTCILLNCVRLLTRLLPFVYELADYKTSIEDDLFWNHSFDLKLGNFIVNSEVLDEKNYLGLHLITSLVQSLFRCGFTVDSNPTNPNDVRCMQIWEPGLGRGGKFKAPNLVHESNRSEILRLIIVLCSSSFYHPTADLVNCGSKFLTVLVTSVPKVEIMCLTYSLINILCRSARPPSENALAYTNSQVLEMRYLYITNSVHLLTAMVTYPLPSEDLLKFLESLPIEAKSYNFPRKYLGKLLKSDELLFIGASILKILKQAIVNSKQAEEYRFSLSRVGQPSLWAPTATILLWELMQCNKNFSTIVGLKYLCELMVALLFSINTYHTNPQHKNLVRVSMYLLLYISSNDSLLDELFDPINTGLYDSLPINFKISPSPVTTRDFMVVQVCRLLLNSINNLSELMLTTLVEILYNMIVISSKEPREYQDDPRRKLHNRNPNGGLSYGACSAITQLVERMSTKRFLMEKPYYANSLALVLRAIVTASIKHQRSSRMLLFSVLKNEKVYNQIWNNIYSFLSEFFNGYTLMNRTSEGNHDDNESIVDPIQPADTLWQINSNESDESAFSSSETESTTNRSLANLSISDPEQKIETIIEEIELVMRPEPLTGMSGRAKEKMPAESPLRRTWGGNDSLRIILTVLIPNLKIVLEDIWNKDEPSVDSYQLVQKIGNTDFSSMIDESRRQINYDFLPDTPLALLKFSWTHLSLGWYISILYNEVYHAIDSCNFFTGNNNKIMKNINDSVATVSKFTSTWKNFLQSSNDNDTPMEIPTEVLKWVGKSLLSHNIWADTTISLFKIEFVYNDGFFNFSKKAQAVPTTPVMHSERSPSLSRRVSDIRSNNVSRGSHVSLNSGLVFGEERDGIQRRPTGSVTSLHSLNTLNRTRSNTPRNSIST